MTTAAAARRWADSWARGWRAHDAELIAGLYAEDAVFFSAPFREPREGTAGARAYAAWAFAEEEAVECRFGEPMVAGDRALVEYWANVTVRGSESTIAGVALLRFDDRGLVRDQRDYWQVEDGRRDPPTGWGAA